MPKNLNVCSSMVSMVKLVSFWYDLLEIFTDPKFVGSLSSVGGNANAPNRYLEDQLQDHDS